MTHLHLSEIEHQEVYLPKELIIVFIIIFILIICLAYFVE